ncbi:MAG: hypothetical protein IJS13_07165 [Paludibacteraceae bacterium]|nr:hypothetical protein [Paludibacteraceae bacterium]
MAHLSLHAQATIKQWARNMQDGDIIKVKGRTVYLYNSCGCEIDSVE